MGANMTATNASWVQHPGFYIKEEMEARGWLQRDLAFILGVPEQAVNMILSGKRGLSSEMALALSDAFDVDRDFFANLQQAYDLAHARQPIRRWQMRGSMQSHYPVREMVQRGWIQPTGVDRWNQLARSSMWPRLTRSHTWRMRRRRAATRSGDSSQRSWRGCFGSPDREGVSAFLPIRESALRDAVAEMEALLSRQKSTRMYRGFSPSAAFVSWSSRSSRTPRSTACASGLTRRP